MNKTRGGRRPGAGRPKPQVAATPANYRVLFRSIELGIVHLNATAELLEGQACQYLSQPVRRALGLTSLDYVRLEKTTQRIRLTKRT